jgi:hypothetical protein
MTAGKFARRRRRLVVVESTKVERRGYGMVADRARCLEGKAGAAKSSGLADLIAIGREIRNNRN